MQKVGNYRVKKGFEWKTYNIYFGVDAKEIGRIYDGNNTFKVKTGKKELMINFENKQEKNKFLMSCRLNKKLNEFVYNYDDNIKICDKARVTEMFSFDCPDIETLFNLIDVFKNFAWVSYMQKCSIDEDKIKTMLILKEIRGEER